MVALCISCLATNTRSDTVTHIGSFLNLNNKLLKDLKKYKSSLQVRIELGTSEQMSTTP
jgi:hypothetical protein